MLPGIVHVVPVSFSRNESGTLHCICPRGTTCSVRRLVRRLHVFKLRAREPEDIGFAIYVPRHLENPPHTYATDPCHFNVSTPHVCELSSVWVNEAQHLFLRRFLWSHQVSQNPSKQRSLGESGGLAVLLGMCDHNTEAPLLVPVLWGLRNCLHGNDANKNRFVRAGGLEALVLVSGVRFTGYSVLGVLLVRTSLLCCPSPRSWLPKTLLSSGSAGSLHITPQELLTLLHFSDYGQRFW